MFIVRGVTVSAGEDPVTPQNWLKEAQGQPAQALPKEDVGPHLPPGGIVSYCVSVYE